MFDLSYICDYMANETGWREPFWPGNRTTGRLTKPYGVSNPLVIWNIVRCSPF
jgi:hypothetical protein